MHIDPIARMSDVSVVEAHLPKISIIINNFNYGRFIEEAIQSAIKQTYKNFEVIVVDDGSTDQSVEIISRYENELQFVRKNNGGQASTFNLGFARSAGDLVLFLDADDLLLPEALELVARSWKVGVHHLFFDLELMSEDGSGLCINIESRLPRPARAWQQLSQSGFFVFMATSGNVWSRQLLDHILPMPEPSWRGCADTYLVNMASLYCDQFHVPYLLGRYRVHSNNMWFNFNDFAPDATVSPDNLVAKQRRIARLHYIVFFDIMRHLADHKNDVKFRHLINVRLLRLLILKQRTYTDYLSKRERFRVSAAGLSAAMKVSDSMGKWSYLLYFIVSMMQILGRPLILNADLNPAKRGKFGRLLGEKCWCKELGSVTARQPLRHLLAPNENWFQAARPLVLGTELTVARDFLQIQTYSESLLMKDRHIRSGQHVAYISRTALVRFEFYPISCGVSIQLYADQNDPFTPKYRCWADNKRISVTVDGYVSSILVPPTAVKRRPNGNMTVELLLIDENARPPFLFEGPSWETRIIGSSILKLAFHVYGINVVYPAVTYNRIYAAGFAVVICNSPRRIWNLKAEDDGTVGLSPSRRTSLRYTLQMSRAERLALILIFSAEAGVRASVGISVNDQLMAVRDIHGVTPVVLDLDNSVVAYDQGSISFDIFRTGVSLDVADREALVSVLSFRFVPLDYIEGEVRHRLPSPDAFPVRIGQQLWFDSNNNGSWLALGSGWGDITERGVALVEAYGVVEFEVYNIDASPSQGDVIVRIETMAPEELYVDFIFDVGRPVRRKFSGGISSVLLSTTLADGRLSLCVRGSSITGTGGDASSRLRFLSISILRSSDLGGGSYEVAQVSADIVDKRASRADEFQHLHASLGDWTRIHPRGGVPGLYVIGPFISTNATLCKVELRLDHEQAVPARVRLGIVGSVPDAMRSMSSNAFDFFGSWGFVDLRTPFEVYKVHINMIPGEQQWLVILTHPIEGSDCSFSWVDISGPRLLWWEDGPYEKVKLVVAESLLANV